MLKPKPMLQPQPELVPVLMHQLQPELELEPELRPKPVPKLELALQPQLMLKPALVHRHQPKPTLQPMLVLAPAGQLVAPRLEQQHRQVLVSLRIKPGLQLFRLGLPRLLRPHHRGAFGWFKATGCVGCRREPERSRRRSGGGRQEILPEI